jgi:shikimate kinase
MSKPNIILTGFMATGKTTVGKLLAEQLGYEFVDTDDVIVARSKMTIHEIFRIRGETAFREMESEVARDLGEREGLVISTGGGMMLNPDNAAALIRKGQVFCLVATPEEILNRVLKDRHVKRPLIDTPDPMQRIAGLMAQRKEGYGRFPQMVTSGKTAKEVARNLMSIFQAGPNLRM